MTQNKIQLGLLATTAVGVLLTLLSVIFTRGDIQQDRFLDLEEKLLEHLDNQMTCNL